MKNNKESGTRQVCGRLVEAFDSILHAINTSLDLTEPEKEKVSPIIVKSRDQAIESFIYGIEDEPVGVEIFYNKAKLNDESYEMQQAFESLDLTEFSRFDSNGKPKP